MVKTNVPTSFVEEISADIDLLMLKRADSQDYTIWASNTVGNLPQSVISITMKFMIDRNSGL
jgi:hypothetical protein